MAARPSAFVSAWKAAFGEGVEVSGLDSGAADTDDMCLVPPKMHYAKKIQSH
jgi:hypothetical protein